VEGDQAAGIATLPVWLGEKAAKRVIALATACTYGCAGLLLNLWWVIPLGTVWLGIHLFLLFRQPYNEKWVFLTLLVALAGLVLFLFFS
jgi:1,4-dihydroxy-2-naphthoate octaprenyltransferase